MVVPFLFHRANPKRMVTETSISGEVMLGGKGGSIAPRIMFSTAWSRSAKPLLLTTA